MTKKKIIIDPVSRVEGHGRVTIHLNDKDELDDAKLHIVEFRGFEKFVQGRPYWEAPVLVQRLCGICPVSHHLCAAKAIDQVVGVNDETITPSAAKLRRLMHYGQVLQSHALHYFYLAAPDLLLGMNSEVETRNIIGLAQMNQDLAKKGILLRKFGQEIIRATAGKKIHGISAVPGGVHKSLSTDEIDSFKRGGDIPSINEVISWCTEVLDHYKTYHRKNQSEILSFDQLESNYLSLIGKNGELELYHGNLRCISATGKKVLDDMNYLKYLDVYQEDVKEWSYMKFPFLKHLGRENGWVRVGPLARLNTCEYIDSPLAQKELEDFRSHNGRFPHGTLLYHWARLIEILHCAEKIQLLLDDPDVTKDDLMAKGNRESEGIGFLEAPRGTLIHHYKVAPDDQITKCNLIVSTTHNNIAMNKSVTQRAHHIWSKHKERGEEFLNEIEVAIRAYDPCLSCATHAIGQMPLKIEIRNNENDLIRTIER
ncbi:MAG: Ni/Fe hydrogenase subunit alpha [Bacteriovoracaceae bacterium]|nr:Ni/Fe hydrogenase subunit alpha [Bacteriovoracaceae bacterium]